MDREAIENALVLAETIESSINAVLIRGGVSKTVYARIKTVQEANDLFELACRRALRGTYGSDAAEKPDTQAAA